MHSPFNGLKSYSHYWLLGCLLTLPSLALGQVDSLINLLETVSEEDTPTILNALCWELRNEDSRRALSYGLQSIEASKTAKDPYNLIKAYSFTGVVYRNLGYYREALEYYTLGLELALTEDDREQQCYGYINIANLFLLIENPEFSLQQLKRSQSLAVELNNPSILGYLHLNFGRVYLALEQNDSALFHLQEALDIREATGTPHNQSVCKKYLGDAYYQLADFKAAQRAYEEAITMMYMDNDQALFSATLNGLA
ncbi:MAG: tetratricopeptide repeat protein, partial [Bacteroidota bacterium]